MKYLVTFGPDSREVIAANEADAWAAYCAIVPAAMKHPNLYQRVIVEVAPIAPAEPAIAGPVDELQPLPEPLNETLPEPAPELPLESISETLPEAEPVAETPEPPAESV